MGTPPPHHALLKPVKVYHSTGGVQLSKLLWVCLQLNVLLLTLISLLVHGNIICLDITGHQCHSEMSLL